MFLSRKARFCVESRMGPVLNKICIKYSWHRGTNPCFLPALGSVVLWKCCKRLRRNSREQPVVQQQSRTWKRWKECTQTIRTWRRSYSWLCVLFVKKYRLVFFRTVPARSVHSASCTEPKYMALRWNGCEDFSFLPANHCLVFLLKMKWKCLKQTKHCPPPQPNHITLMN